MLPFHIKKSLFLCRSVSLCSSSLVFRLFFTDSFIYPVRSSLFFEVKARIMLMRQIDSAVKAPNLLLSAVEMDELQNFLKEMTCGYQFWTVLIICLLTDNDIH